jgi:hypothetical protein
VWRRTVLAAEGVSQAFRRGILDAIDVSIRNIAGLFVRILLIYSAFAAILYMLSEVLHAEWRP